MYEDALCSGNALTKESTELKSTETAGPSNDDASRTAAMAEWPAALRADRTGEP